MKADVYTRVTDKIVTDLENGVCTWLKPWNAERAAGQITRPLRFNGTPYNGIIVLMLWESAVEPMLRCLKLSPHTVGCETPASHPMTRDPFPVRFKGKFPG